jgi:hypothetical protein
MLKIKDEYKGVSVEYLAGAVRVTKKIDQLTEVDINTAKKWGVNLEKYFEIEVEKTETNFVDDLCQQIGDKFIEDAEQVFNSVKYEGIEVKPKRKRK